MPTSRWLMTERLSLCTNSIGSSIVTMCLFIVTFMWSIIAASVVDLPEPVVPVSRMIPRSSSARSRTTGGSESSSIVEILVGIARQASEIRPRWRNALTRKRATSAISKEKSTSCSSANSFSLIWSLSSSCSACSVSSALSGCAALVGAEHALHAIQRRRVDLQVQVGAIAGHELAQRCVHVEHAHCIG